MPAYNKTQSQAKLHNFLFEPNIYIAALATLKGDLTAEKIAAGMSSTKDVASVSAFGNKMTLCRCSMLGNK